MDAVFHQGLFPAGEPVHKEARTTRVKEKAPEMGLVCKFSRVPSLGFQGSMPLLHYSRL